MKLKRGNKNNDPPIEPHRMSVEQYEDQVFNNAIEFRVQRYVGTTQERVSFTDFSDALKLFIAVLQAGGRVSMYAVTEIGAFTLLPKKRMYHFEQMWLKKQMSKRS